MHEYIACMWYYVLWKFISKWKVRRQTAHVHFPTLYYGIPENSWRSSWMNLVRNSWSIYIQLFLCRLENLNEFRELNLIFSSKYLFSIILLISLTRTYSNICARIDFDIGHKRNVASFSLTHGGLLHLNHSNFIVFICSFTNSIPIGMFPTSFQREIQQGNKISSCKTYCLNLLKYIYCRYNAYTFNICITEVVEE